MGHSLEEKKREKKADLLSVVFSLQDTNRMLWVAVEIHLHCALGGGGVCQAITFPPPTIEWHQMLEEQLLWADDVHVGPFGTY